MAAHYGPTPSRRSQGGPIPPANCGKSCAAGPSAPPTWITCWPGSRTSATWTTAATRRHSPPRVWPTRNSAGRASSRTCANVAWRRPWPHAVQRVYQDVDEEALIEDLIRRKYRLAPREGLFREDKDLAAAYRRLLSARVPAAG